VVLANGGREPNGGPGFRAYTPNLPERYVPPPGDTSGGSAAGQPVQTPVQPHVQPGESGTAGGNGAPGGNGPSGHENQQ
jgi:hypothetical protein